MPTVKLTERSLKQLATEAVQEDFLDKDFTAGGSFGVRVGRSGKKSFFLLYSVRGNRRRVTLGSHPVVSLDEARYRALRLLKDLDEGRDPRSITVDRDRGFSFEKFSEQFLLEEIKPRCSPATRREYERILRTELLPRWGDSMVAKIRAKEIRQLLNEISEERGSPVMANRVRALVSKLFATALRQGLVSENPVSAIEPAHAVPRPERILQENEISLLWKSLRAERPATAALFKLLLLTGQLPGELLQMRWSDLGGNVWRIPPKRSAAGTSRRGPSHSSRKRSAAAAQASELARTVPLSSFAQQTLDELKRAMAAEGVRPSIAKANARGDFIFSADGTTPMVYIRRASARISARMGGDHFSPTDLRRTAAFYLARLGTRPDIINEILGRASQRATISYGTSSYDTQRDMEQALERLGSFIEKSTRPPRTPGGPGPIPVRNKKRKNRPREAPPHTAKIIPLFSEDF